jgi:hypothetical protein
VSTATPEAGPGAAWRAQHGLDRGGAAATAAAAALPPAGPASLTSRTAWDAFTDMEVMASPSEVASLLASAASQHQPLLFPTPRELAVRDFDGVPLRWASAGPSHTFAAKVQPDEYFTWQIGLLTAASGASFNVTRYSVSLPSDSSVSAANLTCFNLGGVGYVPPPPHLCILWRGLDHHRVPVHTHTSALSMNGAASTSVKDYATLVVCSNL